MRTFADLLSGGGGASLGAMAAGLQPVWSVEYDPLIADSYERNIGPHVIRAMVQDVDYSALPSVWMLHMSPVCTNASNAKVGGEESELDIEIAEACCRAIRQTRPVNVSLENVYPYRNFESFRRICQTLTDCGYNFKYWHLNSADFAVPQTRKRLILLASRERSVSKPTPSHQDREKMTGQIDLFSSQRLPWVGWYEAIEDLIPTLPESRFAEWQLKRLPDLAETMLVGQQFDKSSEYQDRAPQVAPAAQPAMTVTSSLQGKGKMPAAFLVGDQQAEGGRSISVRNADAPALTVDTRPCQKRRAFIVRPTDQLDSVQISRDGDQPVWTLTNGNTSHARVKAFIIDGKANDHGESVTLPKCDAPIFALVAQHGQRQAVRAFVVDGQNARADRLTVRTDSQPMHSITNQAKAYSRAWLSQGRVVAMTPRALARFQSIPDSYTLPESNGLACRIIGNACPPLLMQRIYEQLSD